MVIAALILAVIVAVWAVVERSLPTALLAVAVLLVALHASPWGG